MSLRQNDFKRRWSVTVFSYQSECHCAKTEAKKLTVVLSLVTSQNVTAPKQDFQALLGHCCLVTSQNVTAPKRDGEVVDARRGLVTSQNVTAPKLILS